MQHLQGPFAVTGCTTHTNVCMEVAEESTFPPQPLFLIIPAVLTLLQLLGLGVPRRGQQDPQPHHRGHRNATRPLPLVSALEPRSACSFHLSLFKTQSNNVSGRKIAGGNKAVLQTLCRQFILPYMENNGRGLWYSSRTAAFFRRDVPAPL